MDQTSTCAETKQELRRALRRLRQQISPFYRHQAEQRLAKLAGCLLRPQRRIAMYMAVGSEISLAPLIKAARKRRCKIYLPEVPKRGRKMRFIALTPHMKWQKNRFGILEPKGQVIAAHQLNTVFMPLIGFDQQGFRLGQGGGFYDATFCGQRFRRAKLIGIAFARQQVSQLPVEPWDTPLDSVITEKKRLKFLRKDNKLKLNMNSESCF